jgi:acetylxylan esterase
VVRRPVRALGALVLGALVLVAPLAACTATPASRGAASPSRTRAASSAANTSASPTPGASQSAPLAPGSFAQVADFGANPGGIAMFLDVPKHLPEHAPVVVVIHGCGDNAEHFHNATGYALLAQEDGFLAVYPDASRPDRCFDVSSQAAMRHDGGSDPTSIANMVRWVLAHYSTDAHRVFVTGYSSGAIMTETLLADYPDLFAAGSAFAGAPVGCMATSAPAPGPTGVTAFPVACGTGRLTQSARQWGDVVRAAYPGYTGPRPRVQLWHGADDPVLNERNLVEAVKQWTDVLGVSATPVSTDAATAGYTRTRYGSAGDQPPVEATSEAGGTHQIPLDADAVVRFFGLDRPAGPDHSPGPTATG